MLNGSGVRKLFSGKLGKLKIAAYTALPDIIKFARFNRREDDNQGRADLAEILFFDSVVLIEEKVYYFGFNVYHLKNGKFVYHAIMPSTPIK